MDGTLHRMRTELLNQEVKLATKAAATRLAPLTHASGNGPSVPLAGKKGHVVELLGGRQFMTFSAVNLRNLDESS